MKEKRAKRGEVIRFNMTVYHDENQSLVEHLLTLPKGAARARRMSTLALIGLLSEKVVMSPSCHVSRTSDVSGAREIERAGKGEIAVGEEGRAEAGHEPQLTPAEVAMLMGRRDADS
jgi:hypothetical protein